MLPVVTAALLQQPGRDACVLSRARLFEAPRMPPVSWARAVILASILKWVTVSSSNGVPDPGLEPHLLQLPH